jgi:hypothetical protein
VCYHLIYFAVEIEKTALSLGLHLHYCWIFFDFGELPFIYPLHLTTIIAHILKVGKVLRFSNLEAFLFFYNFVFDFYPLLLILRKF